MILLLPELSVPVSQVQEIQGIKIVTYCSPLYFANSEIFRQKVIAKVRLSPRVTGGAGQSTPDDALKGAGS